MKASFFKQLLDDTVGATAIEYGLVVALIAVTAIGAIWGVSDTTSRMWDRVETRSVDAMTN